MRVPGRFWTCLAVTALLSIGLRAQPPALPGHLGVGLTNIDSDRATALKLGEPRGVEVRSVEEDSPAEHAGIATGDVLLTYNGEDILSAPQLGRLVNETPPGRKVKIEYWRNGKAKGIVVTIAPTPARVPDPIASLSGLRAWNVSDVPRMLMLWENLALGIECEPIDAQIAQYFGVHSGVLVRRAEKGFAGEKAGLRAGDVITAIDARPVTEPRDLISYLRTGRQPGKTLTLQILRDRKQHSFSVTLDDATGVP